MSSTLYTGIDIGADSVKVVSLRRCGTRYRVVGAGMAHIPHTPDDEGEPEELVSHILKRLIRSQRIPVGRVVLGLTGRGSLLRYTSAPAVQPWKLQMLMSYEVEESAAGRNDVAWDYRILDLPEVEEGQFTILLAQAQDEVIMKRLNTALRAGYRAERIDMQCLAAHNLYAISPQCVDEENVLVLDIGAEESNISLQYGDSFYFARAFSGGGRRFTGRLENEFSISYEKAEKLKLSGDGITPEPADDEIVDDQQVRIARALRAEASVLAGNIQTSMSFFHNQVFRALNAQERQKRIDETQPQRVLLTGGGALLPGLDTFLSERMHIPVERLDVAASLPDRKGSAEVALVADKSSYFACAAGLALGQARAHGVSLNLIPEVERKRRDFWQKTVYIGTAAVAAVLVLVFSVFLSYRNLAATKEADEVRRQALAAAQSGQEEFEETRKKNRRLSEMVNALQRRARAGHLKLLCLDALRRHTPEDFFFFRADMETSFPYGGSSGRTSNVTTVVTRRRRTARDDSAAEDKRSDNGSNVSDGTVLILEGYCLAEDELSASAKVTGLVDRLNALEPPVFMEVAQTFREWVDEADTLKPFFTGESEVFTSKSPGAALLFRLECVVAGGDE